MSRAFAGRGDAIGRLRRTRVIIVVAVLIRAVAIGAIAGVSILIASLAADAMFVLSRGVRDILVPAAVVVAVLTTTVLLRGLRFAASLRHVARWVEEREPRLQFALLAALDVVGTQRKRVDEAGDPARDEHHRETNRRLEDAVGQVRWESMTVRRAARGAAIPLAVAGILVVMLGMAPRDAVTRISAPSAGDRLLAPRSAGNAPANALSPLVASIVPPAYTGMATVNIEEPSTIAGLAGSNLTLRGLTAATSPTAALDAAVLTVRSTASGWSTTARMPLEPALIRLRDGAAERVIVLDPYPDSAPAVVLRLPERDTVLAAPRGAIALSAEIRDDLGIASAGIEYIVSSGSGEIFTFRSGTIGAVSGAGRRRLTLTTRASLDSMGLAPGDIVHFRAVARDANSLSGPSIGYSETRTIRIVRRDEADSLAVEGAPPPEADGSLLSQRMLILLTEALERRRPRLARADVVAESRRLAVDQKLLRHQVGDIIFIRLGTEPTGDHTHGATDTGGLTPEELLRAAERASIDTRAEVLDFHGDETPIVAINRPLLEAYNHMWDAARELDIGNPARALQPMRAALAAIQRARQAERVYLRGSAPPVIVDIAAVRLQGEDTGRASTRTPADPSDETGRLRRFGTALEALRREPAAGIDSLLLLRVDFLRDNPAAAAALGDAIDLLRGGRDATAELRRARAALATGVSRRSPLGRWSGWW